MEFKLSVIQDRPHLLEIAYQLTNRMLSPFRRWLVPDGWVERIFIKSERIGKGLIFDCCMCGQCVLQCTGMTCPMTCPKEMRHGPCGGVLESGNCEIKPDMPCIWIKAWERSKRMPIFGAEMSNILPPLNRQLDGSSAWINELNLISQQVPEGWMN